MAYEDIPNLDQIKLPAYVLHHPQALLWGFAFSFSLMAILLCHEMGHYLACRRHQIRATLPYFIPAPSFTLSGTFGAFIKIQAPIASKKSLFDIGFAGPMAGFIMALPVMIIGLFLSRTIDVAPGSTSYSLGTPLIFQMLTTLIKGHLATNKTILLHPIAFCGWFGLLATSLNLIPIGQLDGGHIMYALFAGKAYYIGICFVVTLILLGVFCWPGWLIWALLISLIGYRHPPVYQEEKLDLKRKLSAVAALFIFIFSFTPVPIAISF